MTNNQLYGKDNFKPEYTKHLNFNADTSKDVLMYGKRIGVGYAVRNKITSII